MININKEIKMFGAKYSRLKFWIISICLLLIEIPILLLQKFSNFENRDDINLNVLIFIIIIFSIPTIIWLNTLANRIRDYGSNSWIALWALLPFVNFVLTLYYGIANKKNSTCQTNLNN